MSARGISTLLIVLLVSCAAIQAQTPAQPAGTPAPGPAAPRPQPPGAPPRDGSAAGPTGTGRIRGRVVSAETGNPLRRSQVRLASATAGAPFMQMATTDADGRY